MSFFYDRIEMLELFDEEKIIDEEVKIVFYLIKDKNAALSMYLSPYEGIVCLILNIKAPNVCIGEIRLGDIGKMYIDRGIPGVIKLLFFKENQEEPLAILMIKPEISLHCNF